MSQIKIVPLGGVRENGKSIYVVEVEDEIFVLDCGLKYPENEQLGIDMVIPDFSYLLENKDKIAGIFLSHGHADAIGALPYLLENVSVPVFGTELTTELAKLNVHEYPNTKDFKEFHVVDEFTEIDFGHAVVSFFSTTHTIPDSIGISIKTKEGNIVYTGDFKFDQSATKPYQTDFSRLAEIGKEGVFALLSDSSNAESSSLIASENQTEEEVFDTIRYWEGRIIVASVASNIRRVQQIFNAAFKSGRQVVLTGKDVEQIVQTAIRLGKLQLPSEDLIITERQMKNKRPEELLILETGRMGEPLQSLQKMASKRHKSISIQEGDLIYITTTPAISVETTVAKTEDMVYRAGGTVKTISDNLYVSGHGNENDLKLMLNLMKPKYFIPVQGEYRLLAAHADLAHEVGMSYQEIFITGRGDILEFEKGRLRMTGSTDADNVLIDGLGVGDIGNIVLRDRKILSEDGIFIAVITINRRAKKIISKPRITSRGFVYVKTSTDLMKESATIVETVVLENLEKADFDWGVLKQEIRDQLSRYLYEQTKRRPVILPVIMESSQKRK
ncbi:ribonuclease J [Vagococcus carniphilus]|uniref:Ribonuclease J n=1 Tax=Vagococcus carniphilus TaxID=218144 RepID=A0AAW8UD92_9ENTE|nr:ribonuclease J [Vagococcus carniphilus]MDT2813530.1 ribonuclease J [Vagococcus carniphilus]MDT2829967.1 ribonuclease J [Vagococcus carniphilus]MDT2834908.1 ribonuclease J [Vagococcus carniphilus]MDT2838402.1 ribonuclease J [Vagococcus carniphilus]MDT2854398.1 ribonuclease J [Vagococcus carniphilus]